MSCTNTLRTGAIDRWWTLISDCLLRQIMAFFSCSRFLCGCSVTSFPSACLSVGASLLFSWTLKVIPQDSDSLWYHVAAENSVSGTVYLQYDHHDPSTYYLRHSSRFQLVVPRRCNHTSSNCCTQLIRARRSNPNPNPSVNERAVSSVMKWSSNRTVLVSPGYIDNRRVALSSR